MVRTRVSALALVVAAGLGVASPALAQDDLPTIRRQLEAERQAFRRMMNAYENRIRTLERKTQELEKKQQEQAQPGPPPPPDPTAPARRIAPGPLIPGVNLDIGAVVTGSLGMSSVRNAIGRTLMGGHHDPVVNGFTIQGAEVSLRGTVDPYFDGQITFSFKVDTTGETEIELEEAWVRTRSLPWGLQIRAGLFNTEFGRINAQHAHEWAFVNQNFMLTRFLGEDGLRGIGAELSWLTPLPWFSKIYVTVQNPQGAGMRSFFGEAGDTFGFGVQGEREIRDFYDLVKSVRWLNGFDLSREVSVNIGVSGAHGRNATGSNNETYLAGADLYIKWMPEGNTRGFPFVAFQAEYMYRHFRTTFTDPITADLRRQTLRDHAFYAQLLWGFTTDWVAGIRVEHGSGRGGAEADDPLRTNRWRLSPNLTWYPSERSKLRLQYDYDWAQHIGRRSAHSVMLQWEFSLGSHGAHKF